MKSTGYRTKNKIFAIAAKNQVYQDTQLSHRTVIVIAEKLAKIQ